MEDLYHQADKFMSPEVSTIRVGWINVNQVRDGELMSRKQFRRQCELSYSQLAKTLERIYLAIREIVDYGEMKTENQMQ